MNILQLGCGNWGKNHNRILTDLDHTVSVENDPLQAIRLIDEHYELYDACIITCSTINHFHLACLCLDAGLPVFVEKPICTKPQQLDEYRQYTKGTIIGQPQGVVDNSQPVFMAGHQLTFLPQLKEVRKRGISYFNSMRTAAIPRTEGALLSLAVHDIAMLQYVSGCKLWEIDSVNGNAHTLHIQLSGAGAHAPLPVAEIYCAAFSHIRLRTSTFVDRSHGIHQFGVDNWQRYDLLQLELEHFLDCVEKKSAPAKNSLLGACAIMDTIFKIQESMKSAN